MNLIDIRRALHQIPELGFHEYKTQQFLLEQLTSFPSERIELVQWKTGIVVKVKGTNPSRKIGWRTDIDGLPITEQTNLEFASTHEGRMHACGHDIHMTIALGILQDLIHHPIEDDLIVLFQPAEEGPGGAYSMREWLKQEHPEFVPDFIMACHVAPQYPVGTISTKSGLLFANTSELHVEFHGKEGHAAFPHETNDMTVAAASFIMQLQTIISRSVNPMESAVVTIGKMVSGTVENIISGHAKLEGTIRTTSDETMTHIREKIEAMAKATEMAYNCQSEVTYPSSYHQVFNEENATLAFMEYAKKHAAVDFQLSEAAMTGEDFGYFLQEIPGFLFWVGVDSPYGLHHAKLNPNEQAIEKTVPFVVDYIRHLSKTNKISSVRCSI